MPNLEQYVRQATDVRALSTEIRAKAKDAWYAIPPTVFDPSATSPVSASFKTDPLSYFLVTGLVGIALVNSTSVLANFGLYRSTYLANIGSVHIQPLVQIQLENSGDTLFNRPTCWLACIGDAEKPFPIRPAIVLKPKAEVTVSFSPVPGAAGTTVLNLQVGFKGYRVYMAGGA